MSTIAVLGGGVSGLACAHYLKTLGQSKIRYVFLLDKNPKFGGWIQTTRFPDGAIFEHGPRTIRVGAKPGYEVLALAEELGLSHRVIPVTREHPIAKTNFILANKELHPLPRSPLAVFRKHPLFSERPISYIFKELRAKGLKYDDESVYSFAERRLGEDVAKYVFDPMCRGISAGDARELSIRSMFPALYQSENNFGSVIKGMTKQSRIKTAMDFMSSPLVRKAYDDFWRMWTLKGGLGELIDALAGSIDERGWVDLIFNAKCTSLTFRDKKATVVADNETILVDHVFSCIPSYELAELMGSYPILQQELKAIPSVDVAVVYLEYQNRILKKPGFGFLAPSFEDSKVLGIVYDSCSFPEQNGTNKTRLTCMIGGRWFNDVLGNPDSVSDEQILQVAMDEVKRHLETTDKPVRFKVTLQRQCIPQYVVGHHKRLENINGQIKNNNLSLSLLGASYKGAGVPDCIYNSKLEVEQYLKTLP